MAAEEAFKINRDDDFGYRYFCKTCLSSTPGKSDGVVLLLSGKNGH
jgi:hypothetical protein